MPACRRMSATPLELAVKKAKTSDCERFALLCQLETLSHGREGVA